jgi:hypothetical protein
MFCVKITTLFLWEKQRKEIDYNSENIPISYAILAGDDADLRQAVLYCFCLPYKFICRQTQHFLKNSGEVFGLSLPIQSSSFIYLRSYV